VRAEKDADRIAKMKENTCLFSVGGKLQSLYTGVDPALERSQGYKDVQIGKPLVVRYLHFFLHCPKAKESNEEVMVSSFVKTQEQKKPAAESINFYDSSFEFANKRSRIEFMGGENYAHELIYYSKSYTGEPVKLTTRIMELDNSDSSIKVIQDGIQSVGSIPIFLEYLPYFAIAKSATSVLKKIFKMLDRDDPIVPGLNLDLHFGKPHTPLLRSGRIVCIQSADGVPSEESFSNEYELDHRNRLIRSTDKKEFTTTSYFVIQVNQEAQPAYEDFDHFQNAAELLALTNRPNPSANLKEFIETAVEGFRSYSDMITIDEMEDMRFDLDDPDSLKRFKALYKGLSGEVKSLYEAKYEKILSTNT
jgi:hypothetical protein